MDLLHLHAFRGNPDFVREVDLTPFSLTQFSGSQEDVRREAQSEPRFGPTAVILDRAQKLADLRRLNDRRMMFDARNSQGASQNIGRIAIDAQCCKAVAEHPVPLTEFCESTPDKQDLGAGKPKLKGEMWFQVTEQPVFAVAGFWQHTMEGTEFAMVTCDPNPLGAPIHPRQ